MKATCDGRAEPSAQAIGKPAEPASVADDPPRIETQHHVYAMTLQPLPLVESVFRRAGAVKATDPVQDRSLRRRTSQRETDQDVLRRPRRPVARDHSLG